MDPLGTASFAWVRSDGANDLIQERSRSPAGALSDIHYLSAAGQPAQGPQVAVDGDGDAYFVWRRRDNSFNFIVQTRKRSPDGSLSAVQNLSAAGQTAFSPQVGVDPDGNAYFTWGGQPTPRWRWTRATTPTSSGGASTAAATSVATGCRPACAALAAR
jgi:hypothetical protein